MNETYEQQQSFSSHFREVGLDLEVSLEEAGSRCTINLDGRDAELLQADGAEVLEAMEHIVTSVW